MERRTSDADFETLCLKVLKCVSKGADLETSFGRSDEESAAREAFDRAVTMEWIEFEQWNIRLTEAGKFRLQATLLPREAWILRRLADGATSVESMRDSIFRGCCGLDQKGLACFDEDDNGIEISAEGRRILKRIGDGETDIIKEQS